MLKREDLKNLSEKAREQLLKKVVAETKEKINELEELIANVSTISVNTMGVVGYCKYPLEVLRGEMSRVEDEEDCYYNG